MGDMHGTHSTNRGALAVMVSMRDVFLMVKARVGGFGFSKKTRMIPPGKEMKMVPRMRILKLEWGIIIIIIIVTTIVVIIITTTTTTTIITIIIIIIQFVRINKFKKKQN